VLLLQNNGKIQQEIADFVGFSVKKIAYCFVHGDASKWESLKRKE
jgi:hypothetical protein